MNDQIEAACREAVTTIRTVSAQSGGVFARERCTPWLAALLARVLLRDGGPLVCPHLSGDSPRVVFLAAHRGRLQCPPCAGRDSRREAGTVEDATCDVCRRVIPPGGVEVAAVAFGPLLVFAGHCRACRTVVRGEGS